MDTRNTHCQITLGKSRQTMYTYMKIYIVPVCHWTFYSPYSRHDNVISCWIWHHLALYHNTTCIPIRNEVSIPAVKIKSKLLKIAKFNIIMPETRTHILYYQTLKWARFYMQITINFDFLYDEFLFHKFCVDIHAGVTSVDTF